MALKIKDCDRLDLAAIKYLFEDLVFAPVDALLQLADSSRLSKSAAYSSSLSILNSVPEFIARCHGENGSSPTVTDWNLKGKKYLYVYGIYKLDLISEDMMVTSDFVDHAGFLYDRLRCDIAHSIVSGRVDFYKDTHRVLGDFSYYANDLESEDWKNNVREIAGFTCHMPSLFRKIREGVEKYIARIESGKEILHLENAKSDFMYAPGFTGSLERDKGLVGMLETIREYFPESGPSG